MDRLHALIIDDNVSNTDILARLLAVDGISSTRLIDTRLFETTLAALQSVNVIFLDLEMPGANGYEVLAWLRADPRFERVPVIACTVHSSEINTAYESGFDGFIAKPIHFDRFHDLVQRILSGEPVWETC